MRRIKLFATLGGIEEVVLNNIGRPDYSDVYKTISKSKITINTNGELIYSEKQNPESLLFTLMNNFPTIEIKGCEPIEFANEACSEIIQKKGYDIILAESNTEGLNKVEEETGTYLLRPEFESFNGLLSLNYYRDIIKDLEYTLVELNGAQYIGWSHVLKNVTLRPANALIIQDNYILSQNPHSFITNTINIIEKFLCPDLRIPFELLIVTLNGVNEQKPWFETTLEKLIKEVKKSLNGNFAAGILVHPFKDQHHKRLLISNLSVSKSDWGFNAFNNAKSYHDNDIHIRGLFLSNPDGGDSPICTFSHEVEKINDTLRRIKTTENSGLKDTTRMAIGNCENRLLKKV